MGSLEDLNKQLDNISVAMVKINELSIGIFSDASIPPWIKEQFRIWLNSTDDDSKFMLLCESVDHFLEVKNKHVNIP